MNYYTDLTPEARAIIKGREKIPKCDAAKIMGCNRARFDEVYVNTGLITGFTSAGKGHAMFYVRDLFEIRHKEHEFARIKKIEKEEKQREASRFDDDYFQKLFKRAKLLTN